MVSGRSVPIYERQSICISELSLNASTKLVPIPASRLAITMVAISCEMVYLLQPLCLRSADCQRYKRPLSSIAREN